LDSATRSGRSTSSPATDLRVGAALAAKRRTTGAHVTAGASSSGLRHSTLTCRSTAGIQPAFSAAARFAVDATASAIDATASAIEAAASARISGAAHAVSSLSPRTT
jgi:hypothetical protein